MTDQNTTPTEPSQMRTRIWPVIVILVVTTGAWFALSHLALHARVKDEVQIAKRPIVEDYSCSCDSREPLASDTTTHGVERSRQSRPARLTRVARNRTGSLLIRLFAPQKVDAGTWCHALMSPRRNDGVAP
jgi:hypothetical protein